MCSEDQTPSGKCGCLPGCLLPSLPALNGNDTFYPHNPKNPSPIIESFAPAGLLSFCCCASHLTLLTGHRGLESFARFFWLSAVALTPNPLHNVGRPQRRRSWERGLIHHAGALCTNNLRVCLYSGSENGDLKEMLLKIFTAGGNDGVGRIVPPQRYTEAIY